MPRRTSWIRRMFVVAAFLSAAAIIVPGVALAQSKKKDEPEEEKKGYTLPYFFTLAGVLAAIFPVCMPCKREWDIKPPDEAE